MFKPQPNNHNGAHHHHHPHHHSGHHLHGVIDPAITTTERGIWAVKWSFVALFITALLQLGVTALSGSVALLADTIHNFGDAATAMPLWIAFTLARRRPTQRFTYGLGRVEDLAGVVIVFIILFSALVAGYESLERFFNPRQVTYVGAVAAASLIGFLGNEAVAIFRLRVGKEIGSAALIADGYHARADGLTSLAVLLGALGVWLGYPLADPLIGLLITVAIFRIVWQSARSIFTRLLDGVDPGLIDEIRHAAGHAPQVEGVTEVRVRWLGHRLHAEVNITVRPGLTVEEAHHIAVEARHQLMHHLGYLSNATIHVDPASAPGETHHHLLEHTHDDLPSHSHH
ncbi:MAG: cation diffusion facilitator family transporter [Chloroflexota bacterium]